MVKGEGAIIGTNYAILKVALTKILIDIVILGFGLTNHISMF